VLTLQHEAAAERESTCTGQPTFAVAGIVRSLRFVLSSGELVLATTGHRKETPDADADFHVHADDFDVANGTAIFTQKNRWLKHPDLAWGDLRALAQRIPLSWAPTLIAETRNPAGDITQRGLRSAQIGAIHALAAHWTLGEKPALVVLPTGTGKTDVMLVSMLMRRPKRLLVLVPSDALRQQTAHNFCVLGILPRVDIVSADQRRPVIGTLLKAPATDADRNDVLNVNVCISTVAMIQGLSDDNLAHFIALFDTVFFDEAHHIPALSWNRIHSKLTSLSAVGFTATPFRLDGVRVPGKVIYQFPLRMAQEQGYFQSIAFIAVDEPDPEQADRQIAEQAIRRLRADRAAGHLHIVLARAGSKTRAQKLYDEIYSVIAADLSPTVIYSGIKGKTAIARAIREGRHQIVICVDMFGEGFDLPALKIAAMHDIHRSLAITLQFTGRFTRNDPRFGSATLIANLGNSHVQEAIEELYAEDADWNQLIPELSAKAIVGQMEFGEFLEQMKAQGPDEGAFDLGMLRPKTSTVIYRATEFLPNLFRRGLQSGSKVHRVWFSENRDLCIFITRTAVPIDWARVKEVSDEIWDLFVLAYDRERSILFVHSSKTTSLHGGLARSVTRDTATLIKGETMFRALSGLNRLVFHNVGLYGRGKLRFRMFTGYDVSEAISPTNQAGSMKSNVFGVGYEGGRKATIGVSFKGRLWSMASSTIPDWVKWCRHVASKVLNPQLPTEGFLAHTLIPREIAQLPDSEILSILLPDEWLIDPEAFRIAAGLEMHTPVTVGIALWNRVANDRVEMTVTAANVSARFDLRWREEVFEVQQLDGIPISIETDDGPMSLATYFSEHVPILLLADGSEVRGSLLLARRAQLPTLFDRNEIRVLDWAQTPIRTESKWRHGVLREASVQGHLIADRMNAENAFLIDDDDSGESADVVEILQAEHEVVIRLYHCKYAHGDEPGVRVSDLYEVCGQAVRSSRIVGYPEALLMHLEKREGEALRGGRPTRFEKGLPADLRKLRRRIGRYRCRFEVAIVQPGLSRALLTPEAATILAAADMFIREFTGSPLVVYASQ
jgi:superfamily II DNA or RNA helicase